MNPGDIALLIKLAQPDLLRNRNRQRIEQFDRSGSTLAQAVQHLELVLYLFLSGIEVVDLPNHLLQFGNPRLRLAQPGDISLVLGVHVVIEEVIADQDQNQNSATEDQK